MGREGIDRSMLPANPLSVISRSRKIIFDKLRYSRFESFIDRVWDGKKRVPSCSKITLSYFGFFILRNNDERREDVDRSDS